MILYRYQLKKSKMGILTALDTYFGIDDIIELSWIFEDKLALPNIDMTNTISYFTEAGNRKFHKAINKILKEFEALGVTTEKVQIDKSELEQILYTDNLQVIASTKKRR